MKSYKLPLSIWHPDDAPEAVTASLPCYNYMLWVAVIPPHYRDHPVMQLLTSGVDSKFLLEEEGPEGSFVIAAYSRRPI